jgi:hypothetical protein
MILPRKHTRTCSIDWLIRSDAMPGSITRQSHPASDVRASETCAGRGSFYRSRSLGMFRQRNLNPSLPFLMSRSIASRTVPARLPEPPVISDDGCHIAWIVTLGEKP